MEKQTIHSYLKNLSSAKGLPGGGSAAALAGAVSAALAHMVAEIYGERPETSHEAQQAEKLNHLMVDATQWISLLEQAMEEDARAFDDAAAAYRLPKDTVAEQEVRREAIEAGLEKACLPPLRIMESAESILDLLAQLIDMNITGSIVNDITVGVLFAKTAGSAAHLNVLVNVKEMHKADRKKRLREQADQTKERIIKKAAEMESQTLVYLETGKWLTGPQKMETLHDNNLRWKTDSKKIRKRTQERVLALKEHAIDPKLAILRAGEDAASVSYEKAAKKEMERTGIQSSSVFLPKSASMDELLRKLRELNKDPAVHGILVMQPFPPGFSSWEAAAEIAPEKDIDGFSLLNLGNMLQSGNEKGFVPTTPQAVMRLLEEYGILLKGQDVTIIGSSPVVGKPLSLLMLEAGATVTTCHIFTKDLKKHTQQADIIVSATGAIGLITKHHVKPGAVVVDVGYGQDKKGKVRGDVCYEEVFPKASFITPVPGGVGALTSVLLAEHVVRSAEKLKKDAL